MTVAVFTHTDCVLHDPGRDHPEQPARLKVLLRELTAAGVELNYPHPGPSGPAALATVHPGDYLAGLERFSRSGGGQLTPDTGMSQATWAAIVGATTAAEAAVEYAMNQGHAFAAVRPPGHHALESETMGFCFVNNVVVATRIAQAAGAARVLIVDWDVHHGNGTQALIENDPSVRFVSLHQWPWYPGTGAESERGVGNIFNVPRPAGLPADHYISDLWSAIEGATKDWPPDMVLVSAGFDAMSGDPLGGFTLEASDYAEVTQRIRTAFPKAPIVGFLEGGYIPERLAEGALAHIMALS